MILAIALAHARRKGTNKTVSKELKEKFNNLNYRVQSADKGWIKNNPEEYKRMKMELESIAKKMEEGGNTYAKEDKEMLHSQTNQIKHHAEEMESVIDKQKHIEPWVVSKMGRATSDLSDVTHYLDGRTKMKTGGGVKGLDYKAEKFLETIRIADNKIQLKDVTVHSTPKGNWSVYYKGKYLSTVGSNLLNEETIRKYNLEHHEMAKGGGIENKKTFSVYELAFGQPYNFYNEEQDKFIWSEPTKATLYTKEEAESKRRELLKPRIDYYQRTGTNYKEIHVGDLFEKGKLKYNTGGGVEVLEFKIPEQYASALINADMSGLTDEDEVKLNNFVDKVVSKYGNANFSLPNEDEIDLGFCWRNDVDNLGSNCVKLLLMPSNKMVKGGPAEDFRVDGYMTLSNSSGIEIELDRTGESVRYRFNNNGNYTEPEETFIGFDEDGEAMFVDGDTVYHLSDFMRSYAKGCMMTKGGGAEELNNGKEIEVVEDAQELYNKGWNVTRTGMNLEMANKVWSWAKNDTSGYDWVGGGHSIKPQIFKDKKGNYILATKKYNWASDRYKEHGGGSEEYRLGGNLKSIERRVAEVNALIGQANDLGLKVVDKSSTWQTEFKYKPIKYSNGVLYIEYEELDLYNYAKTGQKKWKVVKDKVLKKDIGLDNPLNDIAKMYRSAIREYMKYNYYKNGGLLEGDSVIVHDFGMYKSPKAGKFIKFEGDEDAIVSIDGKQHKAKAYNVTKFKFNDGGEMEEEYDGWFSGWDKKQSKTYNPIDKAFEEYESPADRMFSSDSWVQAQRDTMAKGGAVKGAKFKHDGKDFEIKKVEEGVVYTTNGKRYSLKTLESFGVTFNKERAKSNKPRGVRGQRREEMENHLEDLYSDLKNVKQDLRDVKIDMEEEAGQKGDKWTDADANRYGEQMNFIESQIKSLENQIAEIEEKLSYAKGGPTKAQAKKVGKVMHEWKAGKLHSGSKKGPIVKDQKQAVAIALSEAGLSKKEEGGQMMGWKHKRKK